MACNTKKDLTGNLDAIRINFFPNIPGRSCCSTAEGEEALARRRRARRFFVVYLWDTMENMRRGSGHGGDAAQAVCVLANWFWKSRLPKRLRWLHKIGDWLEAHTKLRPGQLGWRINVLPKVGEIHIVSGLWTPGIIAHECLHGLFQVMRVIGPYYSAVALQEKGDNYVWGNAEEDACYLLHHMTDDIISWLWDADPAARAKAQTILEGIANGTPSR